MDFSAIVRSLSSQLNVAASAPIPFIVGVALIAAGVWRMLAWRYSGTIEVLNARLKQRDDEIADLRQRLAERIPVAVERSAPEEPDAEITAIHQIDTALMHTAKARVASKVYDGLLNAIPELNAAMLTAHKVFGLTRPPPRPENQKPLFALDLGTWLGEMLPLLKAKHFEEAKRRADELARELEKAHNPYRG
jgi:hypothetical protein